MIKQSLGLIETVGLATAIEAADAALKSANVTLVGYELTKGGGMVVVKLLGEVSAISAAIAAGQIAAARVGKVYSVKIIARIADGIEGIIDSKQTVGNIKEALPKPEKHNEEINIPVKEIAVDVETEMKGEDKIKEQSTSIRPAETIINEPQADKAKVRKGITTKHHKKSSKLIIN